MRLLFEIDMKNYDEGAPRVYRPSVRAIIRRGDTVALVHSLKYDYYKFPGGGIEAGEDMETALAREVREEAGLTMAPGSMTEFGRVRRIESDGSGRIFDQENYYYVCETEPDPARQDLDAYEAEEGFTLEYVKPAYAASVNRTANHGHKSQAMIEREARILDLL